MSLYDRPIAIEHGMSSVGCPDERTIGGAAASPLVGISMPGLESTPRPPPPLNDPIYPLLLRVRRGTFDSAYLTVLTMFVSHQSIALLLPPLLFVTTHLSPLSFFQRDLSRTGFQVTEFESEVFAGAVKEV